MNRRAAALPLLVSAVVLTAFTSSTASSASPGEGHPLTGSPSEGRPRQRQSTRAGHVLTGTRPAGRLDRDDGGRVALGLHRPAPNGEGPAVQLARAVIDELYTD